jgi:hypothetical protein
MRYNTESYTKWPKAKTNVARPLVKPNKLEDILAVRYISKYLKKLYLK